MNMQNEQILNIRDKSDLEKVSDLQDRSIQLTCEKIIKSSAFDYFYLSVIVINSIFLALDDPNVEQESGSYREHIETVFSVLYFIEFFLKILGMGFVFNKNAYLRDYWNLIDFLVIIQMFLQLVIDTRSIKLSVLRAFRVLRPLRTITSIEGLKLLVAALISALPLLRDTVIILIFFFMIFAIAGLQVLSGDLKNRCFDPETGLMHKNDIICGKSHLCPPSYVCGQNIKNPNLGVTNFDNIFNSLLTIFQCVTLEGWSLNMLMVMNSTHQMIFLFFIPLVFIGAYFLLNLTLAVINYKFNEAHKFYEEKKRLEKLKNQHSLDGGGAGANRLTSWSDNLGGENQTQENEFDRQKTLNQKLASDKKGFSIRQFIIAKKAAQNMIKYLRERQEAKRIEMKQNKIKFLLGSVFKNTMTRNSAYEESQKIEVNPLQFRRSIAITEKKNKMSFLRRISRRVISKFRPEEKEDDDSQFLQHDLSMLEAIKQHEENLRKVEQEQQKSSSSDSDSSSSSSSSEKNISQSSEQQNNVEGLQNIQIGEQLQEDHVLESPENMSRNVLQDLRNLAINQKPRPMTQTTGQRRHLPLMNDLNNFINDASRKRINDNCEINDIARQQNWIRSDKSMMNLKSNKSNSPVKMQDVTFPRPQSSLLFRPPIRNNFNINRYFQHDDQINERIEEFEIESVLNKDQEVIKNKELSMASSQRMYYSDYEPQNRPRQPEILRSSISSRVKSSCSFSEFNRINNVDSIFQMSLNKQVTNFYQNESQIQGHSNLIKQQTDQSLQEKQEFERSQSKKHQQNTSALTKENSEGLYSNMKMNSSEKEDYQRKFNPLKKSFAEDKQNSFFNLFSTIPEIVAQPQVQEIFEQPDESFIALKSKNPISLLGFMGNSLKPIKNQADTPQNNTLQPISQQTKKPQSKQSKKKNIFDSLLNKHKLAKQQNYQQKNILAQLINFQTQKIIVKKNEEYFSSSHVDIFQNRIKEQGKPKQKEVGLFYDDKYQELSVKPRWKPYQLRVYYQIKEDLQAQEMMQMLIENEEFRQLQDEPYETITSISSKNYINNSNIKSITKRSDLYVTSTLSFTLIPRVKVQKPKKLKTIPKFIQDKLEDNQFGEKKKQQNLDIPEEFKDVTNQQQESSHRENLMSDSSIMESHSLTTPQQESLPESHRKPTNQEVEQNSISSYGTSQLSRNIENLHNQELNSFSQQQIYEVENFNQQSLQIKLVKTRNQMTKNQTANIYNTMRPQLIHTSPLSQKFSMGANQEIHKPDDGKDSFQNSGKIDFLGIPLQQTNSSIKKGSLINSNQFNALKASSIRGNIAPFAASSKTQDDIANKFKSLLLRRNTIFIPSGVDQNQSIQPKTAAVHALSNIINISNAIKKEPVQHQPQFQKRKKVYKEKDLLRKKEKLQNMTLNAARNFFQGKFYSSDEDADEEDSPIGKVTSVYDKTKIVTFDQSLQEKKGNKVAEVFLKKQNLEKQKLYEDKDDPFFECINRVVLKKHKELEGTITSNQTIEASQSAKKEEDEISDVPSSLYSDYEELKKEERREIFNKNYSKTFGIMLNQVKGKTHKNNFDYDRLRIRDWSRKKHVSRWSGQDILAQSMNDDQAKYIVSHLNAIRIWPSGPNGLFKKLRYNLKTLVESGFFENFMTMSVIINTIVLGFDTYDSSEELSAILRTFNLVFTYIFCAEMVLKIMGIGPKNYFRDLMNYLDGAVVFLSIIEVIFNSQSDSKKGSSLSAFRVVRIFRTFRVLRVARLLRSLHSMQIIIGVIQRSVKSFIYIAMLLFLFIYIYALLGMVLFGDLKKYPIGNNLSNGNKGPVSRGNFNNFHNSFITVFQLLTMENWQYILYDSMHFSTMPYSVTAIYFVSWIFIGNFILLNLFLAILLDSFLNEEEEEEEIQKNEEKKKQELEEKNKSSGIINQDSQTNKEDLIKKRNQRRKTLHAIGNSNNKSGKEAVGKLSHVGQQRRKSNNQQMQELMLIMSKRKGSASFNGGDQNQETSQDEFQKLEDMDFDDKMSLMTSLGIKTSKQESQVTTIEDLYKEIYCETSFYLLSKKNALRIFCLKIVKHRYFERTILAFIITSSIKLVVDTYFMDDGDNSPQQLLLQQIDYIFNVIFAIEALIKAVAFGFIIDNGTYLRESWNIIDFFIVVSSLLDTMIASLNFKFIKILRLLRTLRPLRFISHNIAMKTLVMALIESISSIINVIIVVMVSWLMFAILGVSFFGGKFQRCTKEPYININKQLCYKDRGEWENYANNFDDIINAMLTLFIVSSQENWPDIMFRAVDSTSQNMGPKLDNSPGYAYFFVGFILIGSFFFLNFFIGVLFLNFKLAQKKVSNTVDPNINKKFKKYNINKESNMIWKDIQRMIIDTQPDFETTNVPTQKWRQQIHTFVSSNKFDVVVMVFIFFNMIQMAMNYETASVHYVQVLDSINIFFTAFFAFEAILKIIGYGTSYFKNNWNKFDFGIVMLSFIEIIISQLGTANTMNILKTAPQLVRVLRVLRISRVLRLIGKYEGLQALISTILFSLPPLMNVFSLLMIIFFIFAILGVFMFRDVVKGEVIDEEYMNFSNFGYAMLMLFRISTGEDWNSVMNDTMDIRNCRLGTECVSQFSPLYFVSFVLICTYVMLNLFVLVILQEFDKYYLPKDNIIVKFKKDLQNFKQTWKLFTMDKYNCIKIKDSQLIAFFNKLQEPLGMPNIESEQGMQKEILRMGIRQEGGYVYFNEMLYRCMKRVYGNFRLHKEMQVFELKTQYKIQQKTLQMQNSSSSLMLFNKITFEHIQEMLKTNKQINPFLQNMYMKFSFSAWRNYSSQLYHIEKPLEKDNLSRLIEIEYESEVEILVTDESEEEVKSDIITQKSRQSKNANFVENGSSPTKKQFMHLNKDIERKIHQSTAFQRSVVPIGSPQNIKGQQVSRVPRKSITYREKEPPNLDNLLIKKNTISSRSSSDSRGNNKEKQTIRSPVTISKDYNQYVTHQKKRTSINVEVIHEEEEEPLSGTLRKTIRIKQD